MFPGSVSVGLSLVFSALARGLTFSQECAHNPPGSLLVATAFQAALFRFPLACQLLAFPSQGYNPGITAAWPSPFTFHCCYCGFQYPGPWSFTAPLSFQAAPAFSKPVAFSALHCPRGDWWEGLGRGWSSHS